MKSLLYIGNKLSGHGLNQTSIETLGAFLQQEGYEVFFSSSKKNQVFRILDMCLEVIRKSRTVDYVIIDTYSTSGFWYAFATSQLCRLLKLRYIPILRGGDLPNRLKKSPAFSKMVFENAYQNVAPSNYLLSAFRDFGISNLVFIPNNIQIKNYPYQHRQAVQPKLLWVRAFASIYNPKMAIDVLLEIKKTYPHAQLSMVGPDKDGSLAECRDYASKRDCTVTFTGRLEKKDWIALAKDYHIFINTTHFDNTPVSVMEAMALGLPVVSTNVGGIPFLLENRKDAVLVGDDEVLAMVEGITELIENPLFAYVLSKNARTKAESWDWETVKQQWKALLQ